MSGCDLRGSEIPRESLEAGYYGPWTPEDGPQYYSRMVGVEVRSEYDGVLYWQCPDCGAAWHRWKADGDLHDAAQPHIDFANACASVAKGTHERRT